ncbi:hypothetical protein BJY52DRAFT_357474 [Lactarius psammicola]|nr:hypothetical protein BJY52DRAFT_357474 [Lactarius psammicola]
MLKCGYIIGGAPIGVLFQYLLRSSHYSTCQCPATSNRGLVLVLELYLIEHPPDYSTLIFPSTSTLMISLPVLLALPSIVYSLFRPVIYPCLRVPDLTETPTCVRYEAGEIIVQT